MNQINDEYNINVLPKMWRPFKQNIDSFPFVFCIGYCEKGMVVDLSKEESEAVDCLFIVSIKSKGKIKFIEKIGI